MIREWSKRRTVLGLLAVLAAVSLLSSGCNNGSVASATPTPTATPTPSTAPVVGAVAPGFALTTLDGETAELDELRGKPVFLTFWTTKCSACRYQMPFLQAAFEEKGDEVSFVAVNIGESGDAVQQYAEDVGVGFTIALDTDVTVAQAYNIRYIPHNFLIDRDGVIQDMRAGAFYSTEELLAALEDL